MKTFQFWIFAERKIYYSIVRKIFHVHEVEKCECKRDSRWEYIKYQKPTYTQFTILLNWELDNFIWILSHYQHPPFHRPWLLFFIPFALTAAIAFMQKQFSEYLQWTMGLGMIWKRNQWEGHKLEIMSHLWFLNQAVGPAPTSSLISRQSVSQSVSVLQCFNVIMTIWSLELDMTFAISIQTPSQMN